MGQQESERATERSGDHGLACVADVDGLAECSFGLVGTIELRECDAEVSEPDVLVQGVFYVSEAGESLLKDLDGALKSAVVLAHDSEPSEPGSLELRVPDVVGDVECLLEILPGALALALVLVQATLEPGIMYGRKTDVRVSSINDCKSLVGGVLLDTKLVETTGMTVYASASGPISTGAFSAEGEGASATRPAVSERFR